MENVGKPEVKVTSFKSLHITPGLNAVKRHKREAIYAAFSMILITLSMVETFGFLDVSQYILTGFRIALFVLGCVGLVAVLYQLSRPLSIKTVVARCALIIFGFAALGFAFQATIEILPQDWIIITLVLVAIPLRLFARPIFFNLLAASLRQEKFAFKHLKHGFWNLVIWELLIVLFGALVGLTFIFESLIFYLMSDAEYTFLALSYVLMLAMSVMPTVWFMAVAIAGQDKAIWDVRREEIEKLGFSSHIQKWIDYSSTS